MRATGIVPLAAAAAGLTLLTGCGIADRFSGAEEVTAPAQEAPPEEESAAPDLLNLMLRGHETLGEVVTDEEGYTLYRYDEDSPGDGTSACYDDCAEAWMPVPAAQDMTIPGDASLLGSLTRDDGTEQVTLDGWPLYRHAEDTEPGHTEGEGAQDSWYAASPLGTKAQDEGWTEGYCPLGFQMWMHPELGEILTDDQGYTMYRFEEDSPDPSQATCMDDCAEVWPPALDMAEFAFDGVDGSLFGAVPREGRLDQVTVNGWPVYRYAEDQAPGEVNGHGVNDTWYAATPTGAIAGGGDGDNDDRDDAEPESDY